MTALVRRATADDAGRIAYVLNSVIAEGRYTLFDVPFSEEEERRFIASLGERGAVFVAEIDGAIAGVQSVEPFLAWARSTSHVATMGTWLVAHARGRGVGRLLWAQSLEFARAHGYLKMVIHVLAGNERALRFYRGLGFEEIGVARKHVRLGEEFHDEIYLEKLL